MRVDYNRHSQILTFEQCRYFQVKVTISRQNESSSHVGLTALLHIGSVCLVLFIMKQKIICIKNSIVMCKALTFDGQNTNLEATQFFDEHMPQ